MRTLTAKDWWLTLLALIGCTVLFVTGVLGLFCLTGAGGNCLASNRSPPPRPGTKVMALTDAVCNALLHHLPKVCVPHRSVCQRRHGWYVGATIVCHTHGANRISVACTGIIFNAFKLYGHNLKKTEAKVRGRHTIRSVKLTYRLRRLSRRRNEHHKSSRCTLRGAPSCSPSCFKTHYEVLFSFWIFKLSVDVTKRGTAVCLLHAATLLPVRCLLQSPVNTYQSAVQKCCHHFHHQWCHIHGYELGG